MMFFKKNEGISLIVLVITVIVLVIIAGISLKVGTELIDNVTTENILTNMITLKAKSKVLAEEINSKVWDVENKIAKRHELFLENYNMEFIENSQEIKSKVSTEINDENGCECYNITKQTLKTMGLDKIVEDTADGEYVVVYNLKDFTKIEIVNNNGIEYEKQIYYTLSQLQEKMNRE